MDAINRVGAPEPDSINDSRTCISSAHSNPILTRYFLLPAPIMPQRSHQRLLLHDLLLPPLQILLGHHHPPQRTLHPLRQLIRNNPDQRWPPQLQRSPLCHESPRRRSHPQLLHLLLRAIEGQIPRPIRHVELNYIRRGYDKRANKNPKIGGCPLGPAASPETRRCHLQPVHLRDTHRDHRPLLPPLITPFHILPAQILATRPQIQEQLEHKVRDLQRGNEPTSPSLIVLAPPRHPLFPQREHRACVLRGSQPDLEAP